MPKERLTSLALRFVRAQFMIVLCTCLALVFVVSCFFYITQKEIRDQREEDARNLLAGSLVADLRLFEVGTIAESLPNFAYLLKARTLVVRDKFGYPLARYGVEEAGGKGQPSVIEPVIDGSGNVLGQVEIWYKPRGIIDWPISNRILAYVVVATFLILGLMAFAIRQVTKLLFSRPLNLLEESIRSFKGSEAGSFDASLMKDHETKTILETFRSVYDERNSAVSHLNDLTEELSTHLNILDSVLSHAGISLWYGGYLKQNDVRMVGSELPDNLRKIIIKNDLSLPALKGALHEAELKFLEREMYKRKNDTSTDMSIDISIGSSSIWNASSLDIGSSIRAIVFQEVTGVRKYEQRLLSKHKLESVGELAAGVAHDFNNVLMIIGIAISELRVQISDDSQKNIENISSTVERASRLVKRLNAIARPSDAAPVAFSPSDIIRQLCAISKPTLGDNVNIVIEAETDALIHCDPSLFENSIINLLLNARDAMEEDGKIYIRITDAPTEIVHISRSTKSNKMISVEITDNGPGVPEEILHRVFDPFFTTKGRNKGTGLGLAMIRRFMEGCGGGVYAENIEPTGLRVKLHFPVYEKKIETALQPSQDKASLKGVRIIVIEDEPLLLRSMALWFKGSGAEVFSYSSLSDLVSSVEDIPQPHLVISDYHLEFETGEDVYNFVKGCWKSTKIILMSGNIEVVHEFNARHPDTHFVVKPFSLAELAKRAGELASQPEGEETSPVRSLEIGRNLKATHLH